MTEFQKFVFVTVFDSCEVVVECRVYIGRYHRSPEAAVFAKVNVLWPSWPLPLLLLGTR